MEEVTVVKYKTTDGELFDSKEDALKHEDYLKSLDGLCEDNKYMALGIIYLAYVAKSYLNAKSVMLPLNIEAELLEDYFTTDELVYGPTSTCLNYSGIQIQKVLQNEFNIKLVFLENISEHIRIDFDDAQDSDWFKVYDRLVNEDYMKR